MSELRLYLLAFGILILLMIYFFGRKRHADSSHDVFADTAKEMPADALIPSRKVPSMENPELFTGSSDAENPTADPSSEQRIEPKLDDWDDPTEETEALPEPVELTNRVHDHELITDEPDQRPEPLTSTEKAPVSEPAAAKTTPTATPAATPAAAIPTAPPTATPAAPPGQIVVMYVVAKPASHIHGGQALKAFHAHKLRFGDMEIFHRQTGSGDHVQTLFSLASMLKPGTLVPKDLSNQKLKGLSLFMKTDGLGDPRGAYDDMVHVAQQLAYTLDAEVKDSALTDLTHDKIVAQRAQLLNLA